MKINKPVPLWKVKRQMEIESRCLFVIAFATILFCLAMLIFCLQYDFDKVNDTEESKTTENVVLTAGLSAEDFSCCVEVEEYITDEVAEAETETEADLEENHIEETWIYEKSEAEVLASAIYYEAGCLSRECKLYVASVIVNRIESKNHDFKNVDTVKEVICQKGQYSTKNKILRIGKYTDEDMEVAMQILQYGTYDSKPLYQHYKRKVKGTTFYKRIDTEVFSY